MLGATIFLSRFWICHHNTILQQDLNDSFNITNTVFFPDKTHSLDLFH